MVRLTVSRTVLTPADIIYKNGRVYCKLAGRCWFLPCSKRQEDMPALSRNLTIKAALGMNENSGFVAIGFNRIGQAFFSLVWKIPVYLLPR